MAGKAPMGLGKAPMGCEECISMPNIVTVACCTVFQQIFFLLQSCRVMRVKRL
jgi:hypothetical protein